MGVLQLLILHSIYHHLILPKEMDETPKTGRFESEWNHPHVDGWGKGLGEDGAGGSPDDVRYKLQF